MKRMFKAIGAIAVAVLIGVSNPLAGIAAEETTESTVTVSVPEVLSISSDASSFTLPFQEFPKAGIESWAQTVTYTVQSNNMQQADGAVALRAHLDFPYDRIDLKAQVGTYSKTSGNTELVAANSDFVAIGTSNVTLANKGNTAEGSDGKLLDGTIPVTYKAVATDDVPSGDQIHILDVTLTTI